MAEALFGAAAGWPEKRDHRGLLGPVSFSTDYECGMLVEGFDGTAVPSHYEPFGLGRSVVDGHCGALVPAREPASLARALPHVLTNGRDHYHRSCLEQVTRHFTADLWSRSVLDVYRTVSSPAPARPTVDPRPPKRASRAVDAPLLDRPPSRTACNGRTGRR